MEIKNGLVQELPAAIDPVNIITRSIKIDDGLINDGTCVLKNTVFGTNVKSKAWYSVGIF